MGGVIVCYDFGNKCDCATYILFVQNYIPHTIPVCILGNR